MDERGAEEETALWSINVSASGRERMEGGALAVVCCCFKHAGRSGRQQRIGSAVWCMGG